MDKKNHIQCAVVGCGSWSIPHFTEYSKHRQLELVAVCDANKKLGQRVAKDYKVPRAYTSLTNMLEQEKNLDAISFTAPNTMYPNGVLECLQKGIHVLYTQADIADLKLIEGKCESLIKEAHLQGVSLMIDWHNRWNPPIISARNKIKRNEVGLVRYVYYRLNASIDVVQRIREFSDASVLQFLGSHAIDTIIWLLSASEEEMYVQQLSCTKQSGVLSKQGINAADMYVVVLHFSHGAIAVLETNWVMPYSTTSLCDHKIEIVGTRSSLNVNAFQCAALNLNSNSPQFSEPAMFLNSTTCPELTVYFFNHHEIKEHVAEYCEIHIQSLAMPSGESLKKVVQIIETAETSAQNNGDLMYIVPPKRSSVVSDVGIAHGNAGKEEKKRTLMRAKSVPVLPLSQAKRGLHDPVPRNVFKEREVKISDSYQKKQKEEQEKQKVMMKQRMKLKKSKSKKLLMALDDDEK